MKGPLILFLLYEGNVGPSSIIWRDYLRPLYARTGCSCWMFYLSGTPFKRLECLFNSWKLGDVLHFGFSSSLNFDFLVRLLLVHLCLNFSFFFYPDVFQSELGCEFSYTPPKHLQHITLRVQGTVLASEVDSTVGTYVGMDVTCFSSILVLFVIGMNVISFSLFYYLKS